MFSDTGATADSMRDFASISKVSRPWMYTGILDSTHLSP